MVNRRKRSLNKKIVSRKQGVVSPKVPSLNSFIVPDNDTDYTDDTDHESYNHITNRIGKKLKTVNKWQELKNTYKKENSVIKILSECEKYEKSLDISRDSILHSGLSPYLIFNLLEMYNQLISMRYNSTKYQELRRKIAFYVNRGVPQGPITAFVSNKDNEEAVRRGFQSVRDNFPLFDEMPESATDLITTYELDPYTTDHTTMLRQLNSVARSKGSELHKIILSYPDERIRDILLNQFQSALYLDEDTRNKQFAAIRTSLKLPHESYSIDISRDLYRNAYKILEEEVYGMKEAKTILLANIHTICTNKKSVIALVGPPGIGKTSLLESLGKALNRPLYKISMGNVSDSHILCGGSQLYIGSTHGKIAEALIVSQSTAPIILLDECDKFNQSREANVGAIVSDLLDDTQTYFEDTYLKLNLDVSNVLFVISMNSPELLSNFLIDRMLTIRITPPTIDEKVTILYDMKLKPLLEQFDLIGKVKITKSTMEHIVGMSESYEDEINKTGLRKSIKILDIILKKIRMFISIGVKHEIVPKEIRGFKLPINLTSRKIEILWHENSDYINSM